jgi:hypothetical protein
MAEIPSFFDFPASEPELAVADWAEHYRVLTSRSAAEPGPYRISRVPYLRGTDELSGGRLADPAG